MFLIVQDRQRHHLRNHKEPNQPPNRSQANGLILHLNSEVSGCGVVVSVQWWQQNFTEQYSRVVQCRAANLVELYQLD